MLEPTSDSPYVEASCSEDVTATPQEVLKAAKEWARDLGWSAIATGEAFCAFKIGRSIFSTAIEMEVNASASTDKTKAHFLARAFRSTDSDWQADLDRVVRTFAAGVLHGLALRGATVVPLPLVKTQRVWSRLRTRERFRRPAEWVVAALAIPVTGVVWFLSKDVFVVCAVWLGAIFAILAVQLSRLRDNGMRARLYAIAVWVSGGMALLFLLVGVLG